MGRSRVTFFAYFCYMFLLATYAVPVAFRERLIQEFLIP
jgi:hypothetical protein